MGILKDDGGCDGKGETVVEQRCLNQRQRDDGRVSGLSDRDEKVAQDVCGAWWRFFALMMCEATVGRNYRRRRIHG